MRVAVVLCTYNESLPIPAVLEGLKLRLPGSTAVVADDDSPDGTAAIAEKFGAVVIRRAGLPRGRGYSGRDAYLKALELNPEAVLEMDADGSHDPADAQKMIDALREADVAVGSRAANAGGTDARGWFRKMVSHCAKRFLTVTLGLPLEDPTSGYRAFRTQALRAINPSTLTAAGPEIVEEVYFRACRAGLKIREVPIVFRERTGGESKLTPTKALRVFWRCLRMKFS